MKTKTNKPLIVMAVTFLLIVVVFFISLNLGVIKIAPLKTLQVFFSAKERRVMNLPYLSSGCPGSSFLCLLEQGSP